MRGLLLWCASNPWLATHVPRWRFVRRALRRFMPGEEFAGALAAGVEFRSRGLGVIYTRLGENVKDLEEATAVVEHYESVLEQAQSAGVDAEISVKPTQLGLDIDPEAALANMQRLARAAAQARSFMWIDMESSAYTDATIDLYSKVRARHRETGLALQAYLYRTAADIGRLMPDGVAVRLVKGAYAEPPDRAFQSRRDVDANYLALGTLMLPGVKQGKVRLVLATHDVVLARRVSDLGAAIGVEPRQIEIAMLYGIRTDELTKLAAEGHPSRDLISYGAAWYPWYVRRMAERPANLWFVARQLLP